MNLFVNKDCLTVMKDYPDDYFDLAIVDPPYFSGPEKRKQETQSYSFVIAIAGIPNGWQSQTIFVTKTESEDVSFSELPFFDRLAAKLF